VMTGLVTRYLQLRKDPSATNNSKLNLRTRSISREEHLVSNIRFGGRVSRRSS
jgi:hypothetical protein